MLLEHLRDAGKNTKNTALLAEVSAQLTRLEGCALHYAGASGASEAVLELLSLKRCL